MNSVAYWLAGIIVALGLMLGSAELRRPKPAKERKEAPNILLSAHFTPSPSEQEGTLAKYEPTNGCYLGAYIDLDPQLPISFVDIYGTKRKRPAEFEARTERTHAMYFFYMGYGRPAPVDYLRYLAAKNKYVHIALEPNDGLDAVQDNEYLAQLATDLQESGAKVFLRFASEMNGEWVAYHGDPEKYIEKWRLLTQIMRERAPNVAMVWCPYAMPLTNILSYYPGDEWVDWVGVNLYNVTFFNQNMKKPARDIGPREILRPVYEMLSPNKPIMICEYATTHYSAIEEQSVPYFAANNILELYHAIKTEFPRVKAINYFSSNNLMLAHRRNNNYSLLAEPVVLETYRKVTADPYFLGEPQLESRATGEPVTIPLAADVNLPSRVRISAWAQAPQKIAVLRFSIDGKAIHTAKHVRDWSFVVSPADAPAGRREVLAEAFNNFGELIAIKRFKVNFESLPIASTVPN